MRQYEQVSKRKVYRDNAWWVVVVLSAKTVTMAESQQRRVEDQKRVMPETERRQNTTDEYQSSWVFHGRRGTKRAKV